jgi:hypothetical protein
MMRAAQDFAPAGDLHNAVAGAARRGVRWQRISGD